MFNKIKKEITECITEIQKNPKKVFVFLTGAIGFIIGIMIAIQINDVGMMGFTSMGGMLIGAGIGAAYVCCCCPPRRNHSIDNALLTAESNTLSEPPAHAPNTSSTHVIVSYETVIPVGAVDSKGKTFSIN